MQIINYKYTLIPNHKNKMLLPLKDGALPQTPVPFFLQLKKETKKSRR